MHDWLWENYPDLFTTWESDAQHLDIDMWLLLEHWLVLDEWYAEGTKCQEKRE